jgi:hypothetical protein
MNMKIKKEMGKLKQEHEKYKKALQYIDHSTVLGGIVTIMNIKRVAREALEDDEDTKK